VARSSAVKKQRLEFFLVVSLVLSSAIFSTESDTQSWFQFNQTFLFSERMSLFTEIHPRVDLSEKNLSAFIGRFAVQYQVGQMSLGVGTLWLTNQIPRAFQEVRPFFQSIYVHRASESSQLSHRIRFEIRNLPHLQRDPFYRLRYQLRSTHSWLKSEKVRVLLADEVFFNLNSGLDSGPVGGFDHNRLFTGITVHWSENSFSDFAYLFSFVSRSRHPEDLINHIIFYSLNVNFS